MPDQQYREGQRARLKDGRPIVMRGGHWVSAAPANAPPTDAVMRRQAAANLMKEQPVVDAAHRAFPALDEFDSINERMKPTGGIINHATHAVQGWMGNADLTRLNQLSKGFARTQRKSGEGSTSDFEGRMYNAMVGGMDQPQAANKTFSAQARREAQDIIDRHQFRDSYLKANGSLTGADAAYVARPRKAPPSTRRPSKNSGGWTVTEAQ